MNYQVLAVLMVLVPLGGLFTWLAICDEDFRYALAITLIFFAWLAFPILVIIKGAS